MIANLLTGLRAVLVVPVALAFALPGTMSPLGLLGLIALAIASDVADGRAARHFNTASSRGMLFDHTTDFVFVTSALACIAYSGAIAPILPILIVLAFTQYVADSYLLFRQKSLRMSMLGRWNGVFYFAPLLFFANAALPFYPDALRSLLSSLGGLSVWALTLTTVASIIDRAVAPWRAVQSES